MCNFVKVRTHDGAMLSVSYEKLSRLLGYNPESRVLNVYADGSIGFGRMLNRRRNPFSVRRNPCTRPCCKRRAEKTGVLKEKLYNSKEKKNLIPHGRYLPWGIFRANTHILSTKGQNFARKRTKKQYVNIILAWGTEREHTRETGFAGVF